MAASMNQIVRLPSEHGAVFQSAHLRLNMTPQQRANLTGKHQKTISSVENGNDGTKLDTLLSVIAVLDLDPLVIRRRMVRTDIADFF